MIRRTFLLAAFAVIAVSQFAFTTAGNGEEPKSRYAANYSGRYVFRTANPAFPDYQKGGIRFAITPAGKITGECLNSSIQAAGILEGSLSEDSDFDANVTFPTAVIKLQGTMVLTTKGNLKGTLKQYHGDAFVGVVDVSLEPK